MRHPYAALVVLAAAVTLSSAAGAGSGAARQRVVITNHAAMPTQTAPFEFTPLKAGALKRDSGTETCRWPAPRVTVRDGQRVEIQNSICTRRGRLGTLTTRNRNEWVDAGKGYHVAAGTWMVVRGTGQYAEVTGGGRSGGVWLDSGPWSGRSEGILTLP